MTIRTKLFLALLGFSIGPLLIGTLVARENIIGLRSSLATLTHEQLTAMSSETRMQLVEKQAALLERNAARTAIEVRAAVHELERLDRGGEPIAPATSMVFTPDDFDSPEAPPPGLDTVPGQYRIQEDGTREPILASLETPVFVLAEDADPEQLEPEIMVLSGLAAFFRSRDMTPDGAYPSRSRFAALEGSGLHVSWPGRGGYPEGFDPTRRVWYQQAVTSLDPNGVIWTNPAIDAPTGQVRITCAAAAYRDDGSVLGVVGTDLLLLDIIREIQLPGTFAGVSEAMLVRLGDPPPEGVPEPGPQVYASAAYDEFGGATWDSPVALERFGADNRLADGRTLGTALAEAMRSADHDTIELPHKGVDWYWTFQRLSQSDLYVLVGLSREAAESAAGTVTNEITTTIDRTRTQNLIVAGIVVSLVVLVGLFGARSITKPIRSLAATAIAIADGNLDATADVRSRDEIGTLAASFNDMVPKLRDQLQVRESLAMASEVQLHLLPGQPPSIDGFDIAARSIYCDETGGDYYDFFHRTNLGDDRHAIIVGDVTGHGIVAALLMTTARALLQASIDQEAGPAEVLTRVNTHMARDSRSGQFMTLYYLAVRAGSRAVRWVSAGHDAAIIYDVDAEDFSELGGHDIPLGIDGGWTFQAEVGELPRRCVLLIGTDGIWEARSPDGTMFGKDRLRELIQRHADESADAIANTILEAVVGFRGDGPQTDDITLVVLKTDS
ncbi:MAG: SpoIIE family protein phosphatase [Planctomycetota bacterium]